MSALFTLIVGFDQYGFLGEPVSSFATTDVGGYDHNTILDRDVCDKLLGTQTMFAVSGCEK